MRLSSSLVSASLVCVFLLSNSLQGQSDSRQSPFDSKEPIPAISNPSTYSSGPDLRQPANSPFDEDLPATKRLPSLFREMSRRHERVLDRTKQINSTLLELEKILGRHPSCAPQQRLPSTDETGEPKNVTTPKVQSALTERISGEQETVGPGIPIPIPSGGVSDVLKVTEQAVDRLSLANNLYGAGELNLAFQIYESLDQSELRPKDKIWVRFQKAQCYRRLGEKAKSDNELRIITADPKSGKWAKFAKWWLTTEDKLSSLKERNQRLNESLELLKEQIHDQPTP